MHGAILNEPLHDATAQPHATQTERGADAEVRLGSNMKRAIRRNKRGQYSIDLLETRKQVEAGTLPARDRRMIERIMGKLSQTTSIQPQDEFKDFRS
jgi:hypothetical protein